MYQQPSDANAYCSPENLLRMVRGGEPDALDRLTRCYGDRLLSAGVRHCRTRAEAEDAVQDALTIAVEKLDSFRGEGSLEGWLVRIVAHACRRMSRGQKNDATNHEAETDLASEQGSPLDLTCRGETGRRVREALLALSPTDRLILLLSGVEQWTIPEIAGEVGLTTGAIYTRLSRLRAHMRDALQDLVES